MTRHFLPLLTVGATLLGYHASARTFFVDASGTNPVAPYTSWGTAATNIQDAANIAGFSDVILVTNGLYQYGGASFSGTNRVWVANGATLQSVNGPLATIIAGYQVPGTTNGADAVRCVYLSQSSKLFGFTLTNGATQSFSHGGGVVSESSCIISNCIFRGNAASGKGGGSYSANNSLLVDCLLSGNVGSSGGGAYGSTLLNCIISNNVAYYGGGVANCTVYNSLLTRNGNTNGTSGGAAHLSTLNNCTIVENFSHSSGAVDGGRLNNSIIYYNYNGSYSDCYQCNLTNCCTTLGLGTGILPNDSFTNAPGFVDAANGDYRLNPWSRCVDAGKSSIASNNTDLDGLPRIFGPAVDIGAYEQRSPLQAVAHYVNLASTNAVAPYTNRLTSATNLQDAVDVAQPGEWVIADDGRYTRGGGVIDGMETNRVVLTNEVTLVSAGGAQAAMIVGGTQTRCAYLGSNSLLIGFTLTNGHGSTSGNISTVSGGGAWCQAGAALSNCWITGNTAPGTGWGGGVYGGILYHCTLTNNLAGYGGGAALASLYDCTLVSNSWPQFNEYAGSFLGGGLYLGTASNCTFTANRGVNDGGGVYGSTLYNCVLNKNWSYYGVGGACQSTLFHCVVTGNSGQTGGTSGGTNYGCTLSGNSNHAVNGGKSYNCIISDNFGVSGAGAVGGTLYNCILTGNAATNPASTATGGGAQNAVLYNCTVSSNTAAAGGGGLYGCTAYNSIVYYNTSLTGASGSNHFGGSLLYYCCTLPNDGYGSFTNEPLFINPAAGDWQLQSNSPCINSGFNGYITNLVKLTNDFAGNPRIIGTFVDVGAFEFASPESTLPYSWLWHYGLGTDGSADSQDCDGDGMKNWQEWRAGTDPTNALSLLALQIPDVTATNTTIKWQSQVGTLYYVQRGSDLSAQPVFSTVESNIFGQAGTTSFTDSNAIGDGPFFYRIGLQ